VTKDIGHIDIMFELMEFMLQVSLIEISCNNIVCLICVGD
jgi:hypothetical protein